MAESNSRISTPISILGWLVATLSLGLNYITYQDNRKQQFAKETEKPTFSYELATYDAKTMPKEVLNLKNPIRHNFVISHRSGRTVKGLIVAFKSGGAPISGITITEGNQGTVTVIDPGKLEAQVKKDELLPSQVVKGYVTTNGITKLDATADAFEGTDAPTAPTYVSGTRYNIELLWVLLFLGLVVVISVFLLLRARPALRGAGILDDLTNAPGRVALLMLMVVLALLPGFEILPRLGALVDALIGYFVLTNYRNIVRAIENVANSNQGSTRSPNPPNETQTPK